MVSGKIAPHQPGVYRDDPDRDDAASTSSAVLLEDVDYPQYPDEELPAYTDEPHLVLPTPIDSTSSNSMPREGWYTPPPPLPFSSHDINHSEYRTILPNYSTDSSQLYQMIREQAGYPPAYFVELVGTHDETRRNGNKETKEKVTDFHITVNLSYLLQQSDSKKCLTLLPDNKRGYRGGRIPTLNPTLSDLEVGQDTEAQLKAWCELYVADKSKVKAFTLRREVINHDTKKLEQLLRSAIQETNYRGHLQVSFPKRYTSLIVYSPGFVNTWRTTVWIRWVFYLTFLWILTWPLLIALTARYEVIKAVYPYANKKPGDDVDRHCAVQSEIDWFHDWESAIRRAALARMRCEETSLTEEYRLQTLQADRRGEDYARSQQGMSPRSTGNAFADGALGVIGQGLRLADRYRETVGWGGDC